MGRSDSGSTGFFLESGNLASANRSLFTVLGLNGGDASGLDGTHARILSLLGVEKHERRPVSPRLNMRAVSSVSIDRPARPVVVVRRPVS
jgi:hypothetical protein